MMLSILREQGTTLIELVVALMIVAVMATVVGLAAGGTALVEQSSEQINTIVKSARTDAITTGRPVSLSIVVDGRISKMTALPDGSVVADSALQVDWWTGRPDAE